ncbi:MAG TPA: NADH-ubiquinone oxidoreductase-F iron-sulfur binding region domain-containing protein [Streptosporangiaceae bacterium]|nr:NADH-ubiquinone oxidoreductase-F iron-sulfur binding region domain-containing protein [Streptosporangiaceae bacterium]
MSSDPLSEARQPASAPIGDLSLLDLEPRTQLPRLLPDSFGAGPLSLREHLAKYGPLPAIGGRARPAQEVLAEVELAGLTGRGGAAFPTARKLAAVATAGPHPVVVVNGTEGEPASAKDKVLLATAPHLVLDGAEIGARIVGAAEVVFVAHGAVVGAVQEALSERVAAGLNQLHVTVVPAADGFVAGEARAVVNWAGMGRPVPTPSPPRLAKRGLAGRPTLVQNAETLAHLALIVRRGADWFRAVGTADEPGSTLVTIIGAVASPGVREVALGTPVAEVLALAGGLSQPLQALLLGGYFGTWVRWSEVGDLPFSAAGLAEVKAAPGAGLVAALPADCCGVTETARLARYLADESAGQCGPCVFGLDAIAAELAAIASGRDCRLTRLRRWLGQVAGRGACAHPDGAVRMIRSAIDVFGAELELHSSGWCSGSRSHVLPLPLRRQP